MALHVLDHAARVHVREPVGMGRHEGATMTAEDYLNEVEFMAGMWRRDVERSGESRRLLAIAALRAMYQGYTVQEVADKIGWSQRASVYRLLREVHSE
jgi:hypothetical protein